MPEQLPPAPPDIPFAPIILVIELFEKTLLLDVTYIPLEPFCTINPSIMTPSTVTSTTFPLPLPSIIVVKLLSPCNVTDLLTTTCS